MTTYRGLVAITRDGESVANAVGTVRNWSDRDGGAGWDATLRLRGISRIDLDEGTEVTLHLVGLDLSASAVVEVASSRSDWVFLAGTSPPPIGD